MTSARGQAAKFAPYLAPPALALGSLLAAAGISMAPPAAGPLAAVFPPWWDGREAMVAAASAGDIVRFGLLPCIVIVAPDGAGAAERLPARYPGDDD